MTRRLVRSAAGACLATALFHPVRGEGFVDASRSIQEFYRSLPSAPPRDRAATAGLCAILPVGAPRLEEVLLDHLGDTRRTDVLRGKSLFALGCLMDAGTARCPGTLAAALVAIDADPDRAPDLRLAVADRLAKIAGRDPVPRRKRGVARRDYVRWWTEKGRFRYTDTCAGART